VVSLFLEFHAAPRCGEVYNLGGGRRNSISILETIRLLEGFGHRLKWQLSEQNRVGDHICYISDLTKVKSHFPGWRLEKNLDAIFGELVERQERLARRSS
jgi:CDP-paratose 2-epimerase